MDTPAQGPVEEFQRRVEAAREQGLPPRPRQDEEPPGLVGSNGVTAVGNMVSGEGSGGTAGEAADSVLIPYEVVMIVNGQPAVATIGLFVSPRVLA